MPGDALSSHRSGLNDRKYGLGLRTWASLPLSPPRSAPGRLDRRAGGPAERDPPPGAAPSATMSGVGSGFRGAKAKLRLRSPQSVPGMPSPFAYTHERKELPPDRHKPANRDFESPPKTPQSQPPANWSQAT